jgi:hypothetical protein
LFPAITHLYKDEAIKHQMFVEEKKMNVMEELEGIEDEDEYG